MSKVGITCKASFYEGMGHVVRQTHVAKNLRNRGIELYFFIPNYPPAQNWLSQHQMPHQTLTANLTEKEMRPLDLIILDVQNTTADFIKNIKQQNKKVVSFEDLGEGRNHVDLLVDCNLEKDSSLSAQTLFGNEYTVLAKDFETYHSKKREFKNPAESILITLGGTDPQSMTAHLTKKILEINSGLSINLLAGPGCRNTAILKDLDFKNSKVHFLESTSQMAQVLFAHDSVFCTGGITLHEAMAVGTPAFVISLVAHQLKKAITAEKYGAAINLGMFDSLEDYRLPEILKSNAKTLNHMSRAGKNLIDGKGLSRVTDAIEDLLNRRG